MNLLISFVLFSKKFATIYIIIDKRNGKVHYLIDKNYESKNFMEIYYLSNKDNYISFYISITIGNYEILSVLYYYINYNNIEFCLLESSNFIIRLVNNHTKLIMPKIDTKIFNFKIYMENICINVNKNLVIGYYRENDMVSIDVFKSEISCFPNTYDSSMKDLLNMNHSIFIGSIVQYLILFNRIEKKFKLNSSITNFMFINQLDSYFLGINVVVNSIIRSKKERKNLLELVENIKNYTRQLLERDEKYNCRVKLRENLKLTYMNI